MCSYCFFFFRSEKTKLTLYVKLKTLSKLRDGLRKTTKAEEALHKSQRQLDTLIQNLPGMVYRTRCDGSWAFEFVSDKCLTLTGYKADDLINNKIISYYELIHLDEKRKVLEQIQHAVEEKKSYQLVYRIQTTGGYENGFGNRALVFFPRKMMTWLRLKGSSLI